LVAVKQINYESKNAESFFRAEISSLGQIRHRNVVQLQGWCHEKGRLLLVYDFMPNGGLNEWLHQSGGNFKGKALSLIMRHNILEGVAAALEYLHEDCPSCVLHRDIKSSNVLLDADFKAHLGDFGLARLMDHHKLEKTTLAAGTLGYMAPEMPYTGRATKESDVYSFGILVLEVVCGRRPLDMQAVEPEDLVLLYSVWRAHEAGTLHSVADPRLQDFQSSRSVALHDDSEPIHATQTSHDPLTSNSQNLTDNNVPLSTVANGIELQKAMVVHLLHLGLLCCLPNPKARPSMGQVNRILQQMRDMENVSAITEISMPPLPATKPQGLYRSLEFSQTSLSASSSRSPASSV
jgi:serine/threonine protein kinase